VRSTSRHAAAAVAAAAAAAAAATVIGPAAVAATDPALAAIAVGLLLVGAVVQLNRGMVVLRRQPRQRRCAWRRRSAHPGAGSRRVLFPADGAPLPGAARRQACAEQGRCCPVRRHPCRRSGAAAARSQPPHPAAAACPALTSAAVAPFATLARPRATLQRAAAAAAAAATTAALLVAAVACPP